MIWNFVFWYSAVQPNGVEFKTEILYTLKFICPEEKKGSGTAAQVAGGGILQRPSVQVLVVCVSVQRGLAVPSLPCSSRLCCQPQLNSDTADQSPVAFVHEAARQIPCDSMFPRSFFKHVLRLCTLLMPVPLQSDGAGRLSNEGGREQKLLMMMEEVIAT